GQVLDLIRNFPAKGKPFDPLPVAVEVLAAAALLQGSIDESESVDAWLNATLTPREWTANPVGPSGAAFAKLVQAFGSTAAGQGQAVLRETVLKALNRDDSKSASAFLDSALVLPVLERLRAEWTLTSVKLPADLQGGWESLKQLRRALDQHLRS